MRKNVLRILSIFLAMLMLAVVVIPVHALPVPGTLYETTDFYSSICAVFLKWKALNPGSDDSEYPGFNPGGMYGGGASRDELRQKYDDYVETLPAPGYTSSGGLLWYPTFRDVFSFSNLVAGDFLSKYSFDSSSTTFSLSDRFERFHEMCTIKIVPFSNYGVYRVYVPFEFHYSYLSTGGSIVSKSVFSDVSADWTHVDSGKYLEVANRGSYPSGFAANTYCTFKFTLPVYEFLPDTVIDKDTTYNINTRPTSITGGNYGIVGDNGQITKVEDNSTIINETTNTFYNPATGTTVPIVNWSYDYSDRSYKVTLESGDTATITYGDENITISQITTTEGDTITNNYTIYYLVDGSGSTTPPCDHTWTETNTTPATCTVPGSKLSTCSKCQQTQKEALPALGHDWQVKQTVTTEYDDTGQLIQEGYTIFECSRCHEQYKSADGTIPPGGGSGTDPGDEEETIWDKLGKLLGTAVKALLDLLGSAADVILGGLIDLITNLVESLKQLVDLFGTVGEAFQVLWTWLPPEITAILVAGVSIFVFVALLKFFMK